MTELKNLPKNEDGTFKRKFTANGVNYTIRTRDEGIGIFRTSQFLKFEVMVGAAMDMPTMNEHLAAIQEEINQFGRGKGDFVKCALMIKEHRDRLLMVNRARYALNFLFCTLFIVRDGEDLSEWNEDEQQLKIDDWNKEYNENDFLELGLSMVSGFAKILKERSQQLQPQG